MVKFVISSLREAIFESQRGSRTRSRNSSRQRFFRAAIRDEQGQVLVWVAMGMILFLSASAFALDVGHAYLVRKQLQASADAAALAAAWHLTDGNDSGGTPIYQDQAIEYGSTGTLNNYSQGYTVDTPVVTGKCSTTVKGWGISCNASSTPPTYNMVTVQEVAHVTTFFAGVMGFKTLTVSATSAASKGARPTPYNIAVVMDLTASMGFTDSNCSNKTQLVCAEGALKTLYAGLDPSQDYIALFTFPALKVGTQTKESTCPSSGASTEAYVFPSTSGSTIDTPTLSNGDKGTYQMVGFENSYNTGYNANGATLSTSDPLVIAAGGKSGCTGMVADAATHFTYFAASIYQAHEALLAEQASRLSSGVKSSNAMIILSDGNASARNDNGWQDFACKTGSSSGNSCYNGITSSTGVNTSDTTGAYPSLVGMCGQAVDAAGSFNNLTTGDTEVFSIAYGSSTGPDSKYTSNSNEGTCSSDVGAGKHSGITPCQVMSGMASSSADFYADGNSVSGGCTSTNSSTSLTSIAQAIYSKLTETRLIPPDTP